MSHIRHHVIVVTGPNDLHMCRPTRYIEQVRADVAQIAGALTSQIVKSKVNNYGTFIVGPDGSKEAWAESSLGDEMRQKVIEFLDSLKFDDGSTVFPYVVVEYGDDAGEDATIARHSEQGVTHN